jgi:hypothetical protein
LRNTLSWTIVFPATASNYRRGAVREDALRTSRSPREAGSTGSRGRGRPSEASSGTKRLKELIIGGDDVSIGEYLLLDILVPGVRDIMSTTSSDRARAEVLPDSTTGTSASTPLAAAAEVSDTSATTDILGRAGDAKTLESVTAIESETETEA